MVTTLFGIYVSQNVKFLNKIETCISEASFKNFYIELYPKILFNILYNFCTILGLLNQNPKWSKSGTSSITLELVRSISIINTKNTVHFLKSTSCHKLNSWQYLSQIWCHIHIRPILLSSSMFLKVYGIACPEMLLHIRVIGDNKPIFILNYFNNQLNSVQLIKLSFYFTFQMWHG